ncbi:unnamed protein product, partial [Vitis vinifera]
MIGDDTSLPITHTGSSTLQSSPHSFLLHDVFCVPSMKHNLIYVSQFFLTNNVSIEFFPRSFLMKDLRTGATLLIDNSKDGVYKWLTIHEKSKPLLIFASIKASTSNWHHHLGHPSTKVLSHLMSSQLIHLSFTSIRNFSYNSCHCNKSHKLHFFASSPTSTSSLQLLYSDVWCSPVESFNDNKYYVIFIDHFTKYIWFYLNYDVLDIFIHFKLLVEKKFNKQIIHLYTNNCEECLALNFFLAHHGVSHFTTHSHTPEHNGYSECRHRELLELGLGHTAWQMNKMISIITEVEATNFCQSWVKTPKPFSRSNVTIGNAFITSSSPRFNIYGTDFGWGRPVAVRSGGGNKFDGTITVFQGAEEGSIDIEAILSPETLEAMMEDVEFMEVVTI